MKTTMMLAVCALVSAVGCGGSGGGALDQGTISSVSCQETGGNWYAEQKYPGLTADEIMERVTAFDTPNDASCVAGCAGTPYTINGVTVTAKGVPIDAADGIAFATCDGNSGNMMNFVLH